MKTITIRKLLIMEMLLLDVPCLGLPPIIKWAGGKERELPHIIGNVPIGYDRYFEPFVGGGSVFAAMKAREYLINDKSDELISLYNAIKSADDRAFQTLADINDSWKGMLSFTLKNMLELKAIYHKSRCAMDYDVKAALIGFVDQHFPQLTALLGAMVLDSQQFRKELERNVVQKFKRMRKIERDRQQMPEKDLESNISTAFMGSLYMYYRYLYNDQRYVSRPGFKVALFVFIRNYAYSGMFRYNSKGEFNVPYGGIGYNAKTLDKKLRYYRSPELLERFGVTKIECLDFLDFLRKHPPSENDFMFLDPPYDSDFSTYAKNSFGKDDQKRLADYLIKECRCKWLMIIKNTPFIYSLYDKHGLTIKAFDKKYQVSFMNRNDRNVEHLIIMNYP